MESSRQVGRNASTTTASRPQTVERAREASADQAASGARMNQAYVLQMQQTAGNRAVMQWMRSRAAGQQDKPHAACSGSEKDGTRKEGRHSEISGRASEAECAKHGSQANDAGVPGVKEEAGMQLKKADGASVSSLSADPVIQRWPWDRTTRYTDQTTLDRLGDAQAAINYARGEIPYAGNVWDDMEATEGESSARLSVARSIFSSTFGDQEAVHGGQDAYRRAASAIAAHGGACNEFSALTHAHLTTQGATSQPIIRVWDPNAHHSFTMIGDPRATPEDQIAVADAWPSRPQAATLADTRWGSRIGTGQGDLQVHTQTPLLSGPQAQQNALDLNTAIGMIPGGGTLPIYDINNGTNVTSGRDDPRSGRGTLNNDEFHEFLRTNPNQFLFNNRWSTRDENEYDYYHTSRHPMNVVRNTISGLSDSASSSVVSLWNGATSLFSRRGPQNNDADDPLNMV